MKMDLFIIGMILVLITLCFSGCMEDSSSNHLEYPHNEDGSRPNPPQGLTVDETNTGYFGISMNNNETLIRNSNGKYWNATGLNIQRAINDLNNHSGTVFLPGNTVISLSSVIRMGKKVILDMQGCVLKPQSSFDVIYMREDAIVKNGVIDVSDIVMDDNDACILFDGVEQFGYGRTGVYNINLISRNQRGIGIYFFCDNTPPITEHMMWCECDNIQVERFAYGIRLNASGGTDDHHSFINGNIFTNFRMVGNKFFIYIERSTDDSNNNTNGNIFDNVQCEVCPATERIIYCDGEYNTFKVMNWDWNNYGNQKDDIAYYFPSLSSRNFLIYAGGQDSILDLGNYNTYIDWIYSSMKLKEITVTGTANINKIILPTSRPSNPVIGSCWFNAEENTLMIFDGSSWVNV